jgi:CheY-like chemotaxis protein
MVREQSRGETLDVLFIEDDRRLAETYKMRLELDGYQVRVADSQERALRMLESEVPDLIFLDITLPDLDAWEVLSFLRHDLETRYVPLIILSPDGSQELLRRGLALEPHHHTLKIEREAGGKVLVGPWFQINQSVSAKDPG